MNWTGGRLQRSKANANSLIKVQKEHFARARRRQQNNQHCSSSRSFSILKHQQQHGHSSQAADLDPRSIFSDHPQVPLENPILHGQTANPVDLQNQHDPRSSRQATRQDQSSKRPQQRLRKSKSRSCPSLHIEGREGRPESHRNSDSGMRGRKLNLLVEDHTLAHFKQSLLKRPDWMDLTAAQPLRMTFVSADENSKIGKRRRIMGRESHKESGNPKNLGKHGLQRRDPLVQHGVLSSGINTQDISIRFGEDIHQSQFTRSEALPRVSHVAQSASSESMLLDTLDSVQRHSAVQTGPVRPPHTPVAAAKTATQMANRPSRSGVRGPLPTLDQFLHSQSFDEVKSQSEAQASKLQIFPSPSLPRPKYPNLTEHCSLISSSVSDPIVRGRGLFNPSDNKSHHLVNDSMRKHNGFSQKDGRNSKPSFANPTSLSSGFWPDNLSRGPSSTGERPQTRGSNLQSWNERAEQEAVQDQLSPHGGVRYVRDASSSGIVRVPPGPPGRSVFTLERQVHDEARQRAEEQQDTTAQLPGHLGKHQKVTNAAPEQASVPSHRASRHRTEEGPFLQSAGQGHKTKGEIATPFARERTRDPNHKRDLIAGITHYGSGERSKRQSDALNGVYLVNDHHHKAGIKEAPGNSPPRHDHQHINDQAETDTVNIPGKTLGLMEETLPGDHGQRDENEAWMKFVFQDLDHIREAFKYDPGPLTRCRDENIVIRRNSTRQRLPESITDSIWHSFSSQNSGSGPTRSVKTSANTTINLPPNSDQSQALSLQQPSETDFLTQLSPMEGVIDERLVDMSIYNNPPRSIREFVPLPASHVHPHSRQDSSLSGYSSFSYTPGPRLPKRASTPMHRYHEQTPKRRKITTTPLPPLSSHASMYSQPVQAVFTRYQRPGQPLWTSRSENRPFLHSPHFQTNRLPSTTRPPWKGMRDVVGNGHADALRYDTSSPATAYGTPFHRGARNYSSNETPSNHSSTLHPHPLDHLQRPRSQASAASNNAGPTPLLDHHPPPLSPDEYPSNNEETLQTLQTPLTPSHHAGSPGSTVAPHDPISTVPNIHTTTGPIFVSKRQKPFRGTHRPSIGQAARVSTVPPLMSGGLGPGDVASTSPAPPPHHRFGTPGQSLRVERHEIDSGAGG